MVRRIALVGLVAFASSAVAQTPPPSAAAACRLEGQAEQNKLLSADRAAGRTPDVTAIVDAAKKATRDCAAKINASSGSVKERADLAALYVYTGDTSKAEAIVNAMLAAKGTESDRADARIAAIRLASAKWDPFAGPNPQGEKYVRELDAMSDSVIAQRILGHSLLLGQYEYADLDDPIRMQATQLLAIAKHALEINALPMIPARPAQGNRPATPAVNSAYFAMMSAYGSLARAAGDLLHADSALMILDEADRVVGSVYPPAKATFAQPRNMYQLVGKSATPIDGKWWVNAADGSVVKPGDGKVSIVQFTAHWCVPCKKSYPPMNRLMAKYKGKPVESIMATELYGFIGSQRNLTPEQEVTADREYFGVEHELTSAVAINPSNSPASNAPQAVPSNATRYAVGGIPEIAIIDKKGIIRATVVGWDKGNEARFAALIDRLLAER
jgi:thiol-disulfide isomerase/thioredoxin